jgi:hypothetical protein
VLILVLLASVVRAQEPPPPDPSDPALQPQPEAQPPPPPPQQPPPQQWQPPPQQWQQPPQQPMWMPMRPPPTQQDLAEAAELERSGRRMRAGGFAFLALAIAAEVTGQVLVLYSQLATSQTCMIVDAQTVCTNDNHIPELATGIALGLVGAGSIYGATAVISAGSGRLRRAKLLRQQIRPEFGAQRIGVTYRFNF